MVAAVASSLNAVKESQKMGVKLTKTQLAIL